jgi:hypothetical protein
MIDNPEEQLQRVVNRLRKVVEDYSAQVIKRKFQVSDIENYWKTRGRIQLLRNMFLTLFEYT